MKQNDKRTWGVVGDLVFLLDDKGDAIPAKIAKVTERDYLFEQIIDDIKIPFKKFPKNKVGYIGGKVFRVKANALAYKQYGNDLKSIMQEKMISKLGITGEKLYTENQVHKMMMNAVSTTLASIEHIYAAKFYDVTTFKSVAGEIDRESLLKEACNVSESK